MNQKPGVTDRVITRVMVKTRPTTNSTSSGPQACPSCSLCTMAKADAGHKHCQKPSPSPCGRRSGLVEHAEQSEQARQDQQYSGRGSEDLIGNRSRRHSPGHQHSSRQAQPAFDLPLRISSFAPPSSAPVTHEKPQPPAARDHVSGSRCSMYPHAAMIRTHMQPRRSCRGVMNRVCQPSIQHRVEKSAEKHLFGQRSDRHAENHHQVCALLVLEELVHGQRLRNRQTAAKARPVTTANMRRPPCSPATQVAGPAPPHRLPERTLPVTRHQHVHGDQHGQVSQGHARNNHQRTGILAQFRGRNARPSELCKTDSEKYRAEKKQCRHQTPARSSADRARSTADFLRPD